MKNQSAFIIGFIVKHSLNLNDHIDLSEETLVPRGG